MTRAVERTPNYLGLKACKNVLRPSGWDYSLGLLRRAGSSYGLIYPGRDLPVCFERLGVSAGSALTASPGWHDVLLWAVFCNTSFCRTSATASVFLLCLVYLSGSQQKSCSVCRSEIIVFPGTGTQPSEKETTLFLSKVNVLKRKKYNLRLLWKSWHSLLLVKFTFFTHTFFSQWMSEMPFPIGELEIECLEFLLLFIICVLLVFQKVFFSLVSEFLKCVFLLTSEVVKLCCLKPDIKMCWTSSGAFGSLCLGPGIFFLAFWM